MRKRRFIWLILIVVFLGEFVFLLLRPREPMYQGKRLSDWLEVYNTSGRSTPDYDAAAEAVRKIGTNGVPTLLRLLRAKNSSLRLMLNDLVQRQHLIKVNFFYASWRNSEAAIAFRTLGAQARDAVPELIKIYEANASPSSGSESANALGGIGPDARAAIPAMLNALNNTNDLRRAATVKAIGEIHQEPALVVPALIKCLGRGNDNWVRTWAAYSLAAYGPAAKPAVPALLEWLKDPDFGTRFLAGRAIGQIDPEAAAKAGVSP